MDLLAASPNKSFDLAIVDPPYGIGEHGGKDRSKHVLQTNGTKLFVSDGGYLKKSWDNFVPDSDYFTQLLGRAKNSIIFGANYFTDKLRLPSAGWIVWDKVNQGSYQSDFELAWSSFDRAARKFDFMWNGMCQGSPSNGRIMQGNKALNEKRIHPTQKPVALYKWLLANYAKPGQTILDTHFGSGSIAIACRYAGHHLTAIEKDEDYVNAALDRYKRETAQDDMFSDVPTESCHQEIKLAL